MFPEDTTNLGKNFLNQYVEKENFPFPEENIIKTRNDRWPTNWERLTQGKPDMTIISKERRSNYV